jgi:hypothetical protein
VRRLALVLAMIAAPAGDAAANGRPAATVDLHLKPGDPSMMIVQATWGFMVSVDEGETWRWVCEEAIGFDGEYDPIAAITPTGLVLATTTSLDGLRLTRDFCAWSAAPPPVGPTGPDDAAMIVGDLEVGPDGTIYLAAADFGDTQIYVSTDDGESFAPRSNPDPEVEWWETLIAAPVPLGDGETRLYLTGYDLQANKQEIIKTRVLYRSDDSGESWTPLPVTDFSFGGRNSDLQLVAVSADDPDLVFARVFKADGTNVGQDLYRSDDAGAGWTRVHQSTDEISGVVIRASGEVVIAESGGINSSVGVRVSDDGGQTFGPPITGRTITCLRERADGVLFACGNGLAPENMALGRGTVAGSWTSVFEYATIAEPVQCEPGTVQRDICEDSKWRFFACQYLIRDQPFDCDEPTPDASEGGGDDDVVDPPKKGCAGCRAGGSAAIGAAIALVLVGLRRRRGG